MRVAGSCTAWSRMVELCALPLPLAPREHGRCRTRQSRTTAGVVHACDALARVPAVSLAGSCALAVYKSGRKH